MALTKIGKEGITGISNSSDANANTIDSSERVGIGETVPLGKLHIKEGDSGVTSVSTDADQLVIENNAESGISILAPTNSASRIAFGDSDNNKIGMIYYNHSSNFMKFDVNNAERMRIDSAGHVTMPYQPAFLARPSSQQANLAINTTHTIAFGTEVFDRGADFASSTFTAPIEGLYQLNVQLLIQQMDSATDYYYINLKTSNRNYDQYWDNDDKAGDNSNGAGVSIVVLADMDAGDTAFVQIIVPNSSSAQMDVETASAFSGFLAC